MCRRKLAPLLVRFRDGGLTTERKQNDTEQRAFPCRLFFSSMRPASGWRLIGYSSNTFHNHAIKGTMTKKAKAMYPTYRIHWGNPRQSRASRFIAPPAAIRSNSSTGENTRSSIRYLNKKCAQTKNPPFLFLKGGFPLVKHALADHKHVRFLIADFAYTCSRNQRTVSKNASRVTLWPACGSAMNCSRSSFPS